MKKYFGLMIMLGVLSVPMTFNSCDATHVDSGSTDLNSLDNCLPQIQAGVAPVYNAVKNNFQCATCHFKGSSAAPADYYFADPNPGLASQGFANLVYPSGNSGKFYDKIFTAHFGGAGNTPANHTILDPLRPAFVAGGDAYITCKNAATPGGGGGDLNPTRQTMAKTIPVNPTTAVNILWNLGTEMQTAGSALPGAQFRITVQSVPSATGKPQYYITAPQVQGATAGAVEVRVIRVYINGALLALNNGGGTWTSVNDLAPVGRLHPIPRGTGVMIMQADTSLATNTIAIGFGDLKVSTMYPNFNPTTYARLTSANAAIPAVERIFSSRCLACHGAAGNMSLAAANLGVLKSTGRVVPFSPAMSLIHQRVDNGTMPLVGGVATPLPAEEVRFIRDWILDGAPP